eukprot:07225.XXX_190932_191051_1 [CDS] Oithona nana genome sequencing.
MDDSLLHLVDSNLDNCLWQIPIILAVHHTEMYYNKASGA